MRTVSRLLLLFLCLRPGHPCPNGFYIAELSTNLLVALSNLGQAHQKYSRYDLLASVERERRNLIYGFNTSSVVLACATYFCSLHLYLYTVRVHYLFQFTILLVDLGGFAPPSRTLFSLLHTAITYIIYLFDFVVNLNSMAYKY